MKSGLVRKVSRSLGRAGKVTVSYASALLGNVTGSGSTEDEADREARASAFRQIAIIRRNRRDDLRELQGFERELSERIWDAIQKRPGKSA